MVADAAVQRAHEQHRHRCDASKLHGIVAGTARQPAYGHAFGTNRSRQALHKAGIELNRKMLSEIAIHDAEGFASLAKIAKSKATIAKKAAK